MSLFYMDVLMKIVGVILTFVFVMAAVGEEPPKTKIGVILPLSVTLVSSGQCFQNSILLAREMYDPGQDVEFIFEDDQFMPAKTVIAARYLIDDEHVKALLIFGTPTALAAAPVAEEKRTPTIAFSLFQNVMEGRKYVMKHFISADEENNLILKEAQRRGYKRVAIIASSHEVTMLLKDSFLRDAREDVVFAEEVPLAESDFNSLITRMNATHPDSVYLLLFKNQASFTRQLRRSGYKGPVFGAHNVEDTFEVQNAAGTMDNIWYVNADDRNAGDYYRRYKEKFGSSPILGMEGFDMARLIIDAAKTPDINYYLHNVRDFHGVFGTYSASPSRGFEVPVTLKIIAPGGAFQALPPSS